MKPDLKDLDLLSKSMFYDYIIIPLLSIGYDVHTKVFSNAVFQIQFLISVSDL